MLILRFLTSLLLLSGSLLANLTLNWSNSFVEKVNAMQLHDINKDNSSELFVLGEGGLIAFKADGTLLFENKVLNNVETIKFIDMDNDGKDEMLIANWVSLAILDDDGSTLTTYAGISMFSSHKLAIDAFKDSNGLIQIITAEQAGQENTIYWYTYNPTTYNISYDELKTTQTGYSIPPNGIKVIANRVYIAQQTFEDSFIEAYTFNRTLDKTYSFAPASEILNIHEINDLLVVQVSESLKVLNKVSGEVVTALNIPKLENIQWQDNHLLATTYDYSYQTGLTSKALLYTFNNDNTFTSLFSYEIEDKEIESIKLYKKENQYEVLLNIENIAKRLNSSGQELNSYDLTHGLEYVNYDINAMEAGMFNNRFQTFLSTVDVVTTNEDNTTTTLFNNGLLVKNIVAGNIDSDANEEFIVTDDSHTYLYDNDGKRLWTKYYKANDIEFVDINNDGISEVLLLNYEGIFAYNKAGTQLYSFAKEAIRQFDIGDMNHDGVLDIAYVQYLNEGNKIEVVDINGITLLSHQHYMGIPNINFLEIIQRNNQEPASLLVNMGSTHLYELDNTQNNSNEIEYNNFVDDMYKSYAFDDYDSDGQVELVRTFQEESTSKYGIKYVTIEHGNSPTNKGFFLVGEDEIRGIALLDYNNDGANEVVIATGNNLYLYQKNGTKIWEYTQMIDSVNYNENHFTHIKTAPQSNGAHKIFVSGYKLFEFDKNGNYLGLVDPAKNYMVTSSGTYANPFVISNDGSILLGQTGVFNINADLIANLPHVTLNLTQGWNLISLPTQTTLTYENIFSKFNQSELIWKYTAQGEWQYLNSDDSINTYVENNTPIELISTLSWGEGFWVYNSAEYSVDFTGNSYSILSSSALNNSSLGWSLLGTGESISIESLFDTDSTVKIVWSYTHPNWSANSTQSSTVELLQNSDISILQTIQAGSGVWIQH